MCSSDLVGVCLQQRALLSFLSCRGFDTNKGLIDTHTDTQTHTHMVRPGDKYPSPHTQRLGPGDKCPDPHTHTHMAHTYGTRQSTNETLIINGLSDTHGRIAQADM